MYAVNTDAKKDIVANKMKIAKRIDRVDEFLNQFAYSCLVLIEYSHFLRVFRDFFSVFLIEVMQRTALFVALERPLPFTVIIAKCVDKRFKTGKYPHS